MTEEPKLPLKYVPFIERLRVYGEHIKETTGWVEKLEKLSKEDLTVLEESYEKKGSVERWGIAFLGIDNVTHSILDKMVLNLLQQNLSLMEELTSFISGHEDVRVRVKRNFEKSMAEFTKMMEASAKAREAYTR